MNASTIESANTQANSQQNSQLSSTERLYQFLNPIVESLGYELIHLEFTTQRHRILRIFIDHLQTENEAIGIDDCAKVSKGLDEPLEQYAETGKDALLSGGYELEVSSPGVDRPLRKLTDYEKFKEREVRINLFRPLTSDELENEEYFQKNPKQKNYLGILKGVASTSLEGDSKRVDGKKVSLAVSASMGSTQKKPKSKKALASEKFYEVKIPLSLISKANLEPNFEDLDIE